MHCARVGYTTQKNTHTHTTVGVRFWFCVDLCIGSERVCRRTGKLTLEDTNRYIVYMHRDRSINASTIPTMYSFIHSYSYTYCDKLLFTCIKPSDSNRSRMILTLLYIERYLIIHGFQNNISYGSCTK